MCGVLLLDHFASCSEYMFTAIEKQAACAGGQLNPDTDGCVISCEIAKDFQNRVQSMVRFCQLSGSNTIGRSQIRFNK